MAAAGQTPPVQADGHNDLNPASEIDHRQREHLISPVRQAGHADHVRGIPGKQGPYLPVNKLNSPRGQRLMPGNSYPPHTAPFTRPLTGACHRTHARRR